MDSYPNITVNGTPFVEYFRDIQARKEFLEPILMANIPLMIDVEV